MAKKQKRKSKTSKKVKKDQIVEKEEDLSAENEMQIDEQKESGDTEEGNLTLEVLDAISDEEGDEELGGDENAEWSAEAQALRRAIAEGAFNNLGKTPNKVGGEKITKVNEVQLEDDSSEDENIKDDSDDDGEEEEKTQKKAQRSTIKALQTVTLELTTAKDRLAWPEKFDITPRTPLPFGKKNEEGDIVNVHDDLKRELAFYNIALEAVHAGRKKCAEHKIPLRRPEDFFAEMVKTDDHMAKVKDRLIFESKKMESFEQRKSNREQKLRAKEAHAHRLAEKAKSKKRHMQDVDDWAKSAASNRMGNNIVRDDDDEYLRQINGPNKKRQAMDRKYGYGGKQGRFKQNDRKSMNDMSGYNPKGNFAGGKKGGTKRKGKRARDAVKARR
eukprot:CAMPEP_0203671758 /NCGR_PEP_ID=MMETSP0090-20130426/7443_1 /ASSEMBLY_ACC=CAM_ASM_001088 /TAXON_ID=426623 /ORGANISM="Chaetoceros affinis, Strain CCMP159" /LENGTH=386 /DNA_ID=CAMNT_0050536895 /DNA_START=84 /DNA_END=1244 /DNA_ORIENTATION=-